MLPVLGDELDREAQKIGDGGALGTTPPFTHTHRWSAMMRKTLLVPVALLLLLSGCYHATVHTAPPNTPTMPNPRSQWKHGWIEGLVPPSDVSATEECPNGVARVETELSFVNGLVRVLTFGIYTPMTVKVVCIAEGEGS